MRYNLQQYSNIFNQLYHKTVHFDTKMNRGFLDFLWVVYRVAKLMSKIQRKNTFELKSVKILIGAVTTGS